MTCPHCGARNTADAPWCTQCLRPLAAPEPTTPDDGPPPPDRASTPAAEATSRPPAASPSGAGDRAVRSVDGRVEWRCSACESWNDLESPVCTVCGQRLGAAVTGAGPDALAARVGRARRLLWVAAAVGVVLLVISGVLIALAFGTGAG